MTPYEKYKQTDQIWLKRIPAHWESVKIKYLFSERTEKGFPEEALLVASQNMGVVPKHIYGNRTVEALKDLHLLKLVKIGDFVISLRSFQGGIEYAYYQGIISPAYTIMIPHTQIRSGYFRHLAKSRVFVELLQMCVTGIREGQNIDYGKLKNFRLPLPHINEQYQIVRFLDWKISKINKLIKAKKRQIALLNEQKQRTIDQAITFSENTRYARLSQCTIKIGSGKTPRGGAAVYSYEGILFLRSQNIYNDRLEISNAFYISESINSTMTSTSVQYGDVLLNITGGSIGRCAVFDLDIQANVNQHVCIIRPKEDVLLPHFLSFILMSSYGQTLVGRCQNAGNRESLTFVQIGQFSVPLPTIKHQTEILMKIRKELIPLEQLIAKLEDSIKLINEYKTSLISSVVTGQVDVRDIAVPEFDVEDEPLEDTPDEDMEEPEETEEE